MTQVLPEIIVRGLASGYELEHLARVFYPGAKPRKGPGTRGAIVYARVGRGYVTVGVRIGGRCSVHKAVLASKTTVVLQACRMLYDLLCTLTSQRPPWGMLTGVRPVNLLRKKLLQGGPMLARQHLLDVCDVRADKFELLCEIEQRQRPMVLQSRANSYSLYVSIPFCPSRCAYCSFVSQTTQQDANLISFYLKKLEEELTQVAKLARDNALQLDTVYVGGGTPTALDAAQLDELLVMIARHFDLPAVQEFTVEAGRPDCTDYKKLHLLRKYGVQRISINPQSMDDAVLCRIGRRHTAEDIRRCFADARKARHDIINMDLIAGLPGDTPEGFASTLQEVLQLQPENITVHTLTMKRASHLVADGKAEQPHAAAMVAEAARRLPVGGYQPYYLYRQKSSGASGPGAETLENTGWTLPGLACKYNVMIMEEVHSILAVGAGACTKLVGGPGGARIQRIYNPKLPLEYLRGHAEVLKKKQGVSQFYAGNLDTEAIG